MSRAIALVLAAIAALLVACSSDSDAAGPPCSVTQGCPSNLVCWYTAADGCEGNGHCYAPTSGSNGACKAEQFCGCDHALVTQCGRTAGDGLIDEPVHGDANDPYCSDAADGG